MRFSFQKKRDWVLGRQKWYTFSRMVLTYLGYRRLNPCLSSTVWILGKDRPSILSSPLALVSLHPVLSSFFSCHALIEDYWHTSECRAYLAFVPPNLAVVRSSPVCLSNVILTVKRLFQVGFLSSRVLSSFQFLYFPRCNPFCFSTVGEFPLAKDCFLLSHSFQMFSLQLFSLQLLSWTDRWVFDLQEI